jgi:hypothetical protein
MYRAYVVQVQNRVATNISGRQPWDGDNAMVSVGIVGIVGILGTNDGQSDTDLTQPFLDCIHLYLADPYRRRRSLGLRNLNEVVFRNIRVVF